MQSDREKFLPPDQNTQKHILVAHMMKICTSFVVLTDATLFPLKPEAELYVKKK
jgi:hypothetical protein